MQCNTTPWLQQTVHVNDGLIEVELGVLGRKNSTCRSTSWSNARRFMTRFEAPLFSAAGTVKHGNAAIPVNPSALNSLVSTAVCDPLRTVHSDKIAESISLRTSTF
uniref:Uncharacterized protein n=2 Tax=Parascaris univalens TaxID=6257 RepID=A0A914ZSH7_PARUN